MGWKEFVEEMKSKFEEGKLKGEGLRKKKGEKNGIQTNEKLSEK
jgi:hypothetical protein